VLTLGAVACAGGTDNATNVRATEARLRAHGYTNDGPATWWWEYDTVRAELGTANDTEVCGSGTGPKEPDNRCGPATGGSASSPIPLNVVVTGLTSDTTYYFRACGQDTNDPSPTCANVRSFRTTLGDSTAAVSAGTLNVTAAPGTRNRVVVSQFTDSDGVVKLRVEDPVDFSDGRTDGSSVVPGSGCQGAGAGQYDDAVKCPTGGLTAIAVALQGGDDGATVRDAITIPSTLDGGDGTDILQGSNGADDVLISGPGAGGQSVIGGSATFTPSITGAGGDDTFHVQNGAVDLIFCGDGNDVANVEEADGGWEGAFGGTQYETCEVLNEIP
jgi:hypothetical protein